jgi:ABC-2 type transport system permease protein
MSAVELASRALGLRLLSSEVGMLLRRRRNQLMLLVLASIPVIIAVAVKLTSHGANPGGLIGDIVDNGIFVAFTALVVVIPVFLPMAVAVVIGESVAGEANSGTLRYLLVVPVSRTRLLATKFMAVAIWCLLIASVVAVTGVLIGFVLFPQGNVTLLSGTRVSLLDALGRLVVVVGYAALMMLTIISTLTEVPIAAMAATLAIAITMQVLVAVPQLHSIEPLLISGAFLDFADLLRDPLSFGGLQHGVLLALAYLVIFCSLAWARFSTKDISS